MKSKNLLGAVIIAFFFSALLIKAQSGLYLPFNIQKAYKNGTRSYDGKPGVKYWQNRASYKITAEIFPSASLLDGFETVRYFNNSPDTLKRIVVKLFQNIFKKGSPRAWPMNADGMTDGDVIKEVRVNGKILPLSQKGGSIFVSGTNMIIILKNPLPPGKSVSLDFNWEFKIPDKVQLRMGNYGDGDMFVSYWYPHIAVYDDVDGWDMSNYEGNVEFYNDFSDYDYTIKVPDGFTVWGAGKLVNPSKVYQLAILKRLSKALKSDKTVRIITAKDREENNVTQHNKINAWHFKAANVTDVSFAISDSYLWDGASVVVDPKTGRRALTDVVYEKGTVNFDEGAQFARGTIGYLSNKLPGFNYPYSHHTTFCNKKRGGGMETPMMADDGAPKNRSRTIGLISHEITHTYFPFIMGTNEEKYAWMDEGWATFFPTEVIAEFAPDYDYWARTIRGYEKAAGNDTELPPIIPSYSNRGRFARTAFYNRPACAYRELEELLGRKLFKKALLEYMNRWNGKHPIAWDFFFTINDVVGKDLSWFWKPWFFEQGYPDLAVKNVEIVNGKAIATIAKKGNIPTRVKVTFYFEDGTKSVKLLKANVWSDGKSEIRVTLPTAKKLKKVVVGDKHIPDSVRSNNTYEL